MRLFWVARIASKRSSRSTDLAILAVRAKAHYKRPDRSSVGDELTAMHEAPWTLEWDVIDPRTLSGGQGNVTQVRRRFDGAIGALKVLHPTFLHDHERRRRMVREVEALKRVQGPGIPKILDENIIEVANTQVPLYFVTEWGQGPTLQRHAGGSPRSIDDSIRIAVALTRVVERCHTVGIVHRDIKTDNIIINPNDLTVSLVDFGTAWTDTPDDSFVTELGQELGNRFLRVPDMAPGQTRHDPRTDLTFVVGVLFFLLTGRAPRILIDNKLRKPHEALINVFDERVLNDPRWERIRRILHVGFEISIDLRFQSAKDLLQRLEEVDNASVKATPNGTLASQIALEGFNDLLSTAAVRSVEHITSAMLEALRALESVLAGKAKQAGLFSIHLAGGSRIEDDGRGVSFWYRLTRADVLSPQGSLEHKVTFTGEGRSKVRAVYAIGGKEMCYYEGPSADVGRLKEEMLAHADRIFAVCVEELRGLLERQVRG
jgi:Protein kinase domain